MQEGRIFKYSDPLIMFRAFRPRAVHGYLLRITLELSGRCRVPHDIAAVRLSEQLARLREFAYLSATRPSDRWQPYIEGKTTWES